LSVVSRLTSSVSLAAKASLDVASFWNLFSASSFSLHLSRMKGTILRYPLHVSINCAKKKPRSVQYPRSQCFRGDPDPAENLNADPCPWWTVVQIGRDLSNIILNLLGLP
jgi:hypothetical protein